MKPNVQGLIGSWFWHLRGQPQDAGTWKGLVAMLSHGEGQRKSRKAGNWTRVSHASTHKGGTSSPPLGLVSPQPPISPGPTSLRPCPVSLLPGRFRFILRLSSGHIPLLFSSYNRTQLPSWSTENTAQMDTFQRSPFLLYK